jgi:hypothetical protein
MVHMQESIVFKLISIPPHFKSSDLRNRVHCSGRTLNTNVHILYYPQEETKPDIGDANGLNSTRDLPHLCIPYSLRCIKLS